jgi:hypothetical protein
MAAGTVFLPMLHRNPRCLLLPLSIARQGELEGWLHGKSTQNGWVAAFHSDAVCLEKFANFLGIGTFTNGKWGICRLIFIWKSDQDAAAYGIINRPKF